MTNQKTTPQGSQKPAAPKHLTVERARELLNTKRTTTIDGKTYETIFSGIEALMTPEENAEMLEIERDLGLKRDTHDTILLIAAREHPAHKPPKQKAARKEKAPKKEEEEQSPVLDDWEPEDNHSPFADEDGEEK